MLNLSLRLPFLVPSGPLAPPRRAATLSARGRTTGPAVTGHDPMERVTYRTDETDGYSAGEAARRIAYEVREGFEVCLDCANLDGDDMDILDEVLHEVRRTIEAAGYRLGCRIDRDERQVTLRQLARLPEVRA